MQDDQVPTDHRAELKRIQTFPSLIRYLRDEMGWPIESDDFEEVTFSYEPEELGIDAASAAKIQEIKRLRPLSVNQPWGIFFVKFEPKRLPVVALRRILSRVVLKQRASANSAERAAWEAEDLLFVSNFGEGDERQITFAHFSQDEGVNDLPTLKVLGWDNLDTPLHLDDIAEKLTTHLAWPVHEDDADAWRRSWRTAFTLRHREAVTTSRDLSIRLAELARAIRDRIKTALGIETERGPLTKLMDAFKEALVHDLDADGFADMYAQTIAYGLLSARIADPKSKTADDFAARMRTNPFLRELMATFLHVGGRRGKAGGPSIDFDELGVSEVVELLDDANMEAVVRDFGDRNPQEDPVIHFYELFLKEYDAKKRMQRGVFYTPRPVVSYIVRSVDELLRSEFGLADGLADITTWGEMAERHKGLSIPDRVPPTQAFVQILDPATGTGTFLVEAIDRIHRTMVEKWKAQGHNDKKIVALWNEYVPKHLLPRLHGYELLMAPYAIAHLKIGLKLFETGYRFDSDERARIFLTNALEPPSDIGQQSLTRMFSALAHEAQAVNETKRNQTFTIVVGNPPYSKLSANLSEEARALVDAYKHVAGQRIKEKGALQFEMNLQDDYVKFMRLAEIALRHSTVGVVGLITNGGYLDNPTLRGMRWSLADAFPRIDILDLHGRQMSGVGKAIAADENVFDIQQRVAIALLRRTPASAEGPSVRYASILGPRKLKYSILTTTTYSQQEKTVVAVGPPLYKFSPSSSDLGSEFAAMVSVPDLFPRNSAGFITSRDGLVIDTQRETLERRIKSFASDGRPEAEIYAAFGFQASKRFNVRQAQLAVGRDSQVGESIRPCLYRPFDYRWVYYNRELIESYKPIANEMLFRRNVALIATRQVTGRRFGHVFVSRAMIEIKACSHDRNTQIFPLFVSGKATGDGSVAGTKKWSVNLSPEALRALETATGFTFCPPGRNPDGSSSFTSEDILHYIYAVLHSPTYRERYFEFLRSEFPRCPIGPGPSLFRTLSRLGGDLVGLHLLESSKLDSPITTYLGPNAPNVGRVGWSDNTVWLDGPPPKTGKAGRPVEVGFRGVPEDVWNFHIGGYQVCEKWLKDRKGRTLTPEDLAHYHRIVAALQGTIRIMREIDSVIDAHGGWPAAFRNKTEGAGDDSERSREASAPSQPLDMYGADDNTEIDD